VHLCFTTRSPCPGTYDNCRVLKIVAFSNPTDDLMDLIENCFWEASEYDAVWMRSRVFSSQFRAWQKTRCALACQIVRLEIVIKQGALPECKDHGELPYLEIEACLYRTIKFICLSRWSGKLEETRFFMPCCFINGNRLPEAPRSINIF
jgi:hypothetical protein